MSISRLNEMTALGADWWNDSCSISELTEAVGRGAVGATSNPVIVSAAVSDDRARWIPVIDQLARDFPDETEDDLAWRLIARVGKDASAILMPVFEKTKGRKGYLSMQVSSKYYPSTSRMVEQGLFLAGLAPNIAIKAPATEAGIRAMEELSSRGVRMNATVSFTVAQALACAEAIERGLKRAPKGAEVYPYVTIMVGRVDDHLKRVRDRDKIEANPLAIDWSGIAVFRKAAALFRARGYRATLLAAAYRNEAHWRQIIGKDVLQSIPYKWWKQFDQSAEPVRVNIEDPIDPAYLAELSAKFPDFKAAYNEDGMTIPQFVKYGASVATLSQFLGGYQQLLEIIRGRMLM